MFETTVVPELEIELKFLVRDIAQLSDLKQPAVIEQYFFSRKASALYLIPELDQPNLAIRNGRVRKMINPAGQTLYTIGIKGEGTPEFSAHGIVAKPEYELQISASLYQQLKLQADMGSLTKNRFYHQQQLDNKHSVMLEIDCLLRINEQKVNPKFAVIEVEVPDLSQAMLLRRNSLQIGPTPLVYTEVRTDSESPNLALLVSGRKLARSVQDKTIPAEISAYLGL